jgi:hypothetical protein
VSYLDQFYDHELEVEAHTQEELTRVEIERLVRTLAVAINAAAIPRRLNGALPEEHAADKQLSKKIAHVAAQSLRAWGYEPELVPSTDPEVMREAAHVEWAAWMEARESWLQNRVRYIATWQFKRSGDPFFAKSTVTKLNNELSWMRRLRS